MALLPSSIPVLGGQTSEKKTDAPATSLAGSNRLTEQSGQSASRFSQEGASAGSRFAGANSTRPVGGTPGTGTAGQPPLPGTRPGGAVSARPAAGSPGGPGLLSGSSGLPRSGQAATRSDAHTASAASRPGSVSSRPGDISAPASSFQRTGSVMGSGLSTSTAGQAVSAPGASVPAARSSLVSSRTQTISEEEFRQLQDFIYTQSGIFIADTRKYLVENRLSNRLRDLNLKNFSEYYYYLRFDKNRADELQQLFNVITTNETSFFRNPPQLKVFQDVVVPQELEKIRATGQKKLRIWSAGCSTGEEPYTLAIILKEVLQNQLAQWDIKITANDLSENVLRAAQKGIYNEYALRTTPPEIAERYFRKEGLTYHIDPSLKRLVSFSSINLSNRTMLKRVERSHIIFCRNVIIYFDEEMKRQVIESFYDNLLPGGAMLIGHSESLHNLSRAFTPEHHPGTIVYRKQE